MPLGGIGARSETGGRIFLFDVLEAIHQAPGSFPANTFHSH
jgi:hypothetical protein